MPSGPRGKHFHRARRRSLHNPGEKTGGTLAAPRPLLLSDLMRWEDSDTHCTTLISQEPNLLPVPTGVAALSQLFLLQPAATLPLKPSMSGESANCPHGWRPAGGRSFEGRGHASYQKESPYLSEFIFPLIQWEAGEEIGFISPLKP